MQNVTEEFIITGYRKTNYRAKSGVSAISGYRGVHFRNNDKTPITAQKWYFICYLLVSNSSFIFALFSFFFLFLFSGWASNIEIFGGFHIFWGQSVRGCCTFCSCYFSVSLCRVLALVFALEEGGGGSQLKSSVPFPLVAYSVV